MAPNFTARHRGGDGPPLLLIHGFTDTWRTWDLVLGGLERHHEVLAPTLPGHCGGPGIPGEFSDDAVVDWLEAELDAAGWETAHVCGNSLGGYLSLRLAERGRARTVTALAPGGGWASGDTSYEQTLDYFPQMQKLVKQAAPFAGQFLAAAEGRRRATAFTSVNFEHIPAELLEHQMVGTAGCTAVEPLVAFARENGWPVDASRIECPVRIVWGTEDRILLWPQSAAGYRDESFPHADWVVLDDVGHCIQLDVPDETIGLILGQTGA